METFRDVFFSIRDWFRDRVGNPFFASFIVAWLLLNWRVVLVLFSDMTANQKITWLDTKLYPASWHWTYYGVIAPLTTAVLYVALSPHILRKVSVYHRKQQHKSTEAILAADKVQPISPERAEHLIQERIAARLNLKNERARFIALETDYLDQIENLQKQLNPGVKENTLESQPPILNQVHQKSFLEETAESLSAKARKLLAAACNSSSATIVHQKFLTGQRITAGTESFIAADASAREKAEWEDAIDELNEKRLVTSVGESTYKVNKRGYEIHDLLLSLLLNEPDFTNGKDSTSVA